MPDREAVALAEMFAHRSAFGVAARDRREAANLSVARFAQRRRLPTKSTITKVELGRGGDPCLSLILIFLRGLRDHAQRLPSGFPAPRERRGGHAHREP